MRAEHFPGIAAIRPTDVQQYLRSRGWSLKEGPNDGIATYELRDGIITDVLLDTTYADYNRRLGELLTLLAHVEGRDALEILDDLATPAGDILEFRIQSDLVGSGTISIADGLRIRQAQRSLLLASAHSVLSPQRYFSRMSRSEAVELLGQCREGQTAPRGSYVIRLVVPVEPAVGLLPMEEPFSRKVTRTLIRALHEVWSIRRTGGWDELLGRADRGVSGNFLSALAEMKPAGEQSALDISVRWSRTRPPPSETPARVRMTEDMFDGLSSVAMALREQTPESGFELEGYVTRLAREGASGPGEVSIVPALTGLDERPGMRTVKVILTKEDYQRAISAHRDGSEIRVIGTLQKEGRTWWLREPSGFAVVPSGEEID